MTDKGSLRILKAFSKQPIAYQPIYAEITKSVTAGILLSQILYWWGKKEEKEFYKTDQEFADELKLSFKELRAAKKKLREVGFVSTEVKGVPARTFYKVRVESVLDAISNKTPGQSSLPKRAKLVCLKGPIQFGQKGQTITETTTEITTEKNNNKKDEVVVLNNETLSKKESEIMRTLTIGEATDLKKQELREIIQKYHNTVLDEALKVTTGDLKAGKVKTDTIRYLSGVCKNMSAEYLKKQQQEIKSKEKRVENARLLKKSYEDLGLDDEEVQELLNRSFGKEIIKQI